jgi:hypothetical protein
MGLTALPAMMGMATSKTTICASNREATWIKWSGGHKTLPELHSMSYRQLHYRSSMHVFMDLMSCRMSYW